MPPIPVIVLSGYLGAGKTTVLNHLLRRPGSRLGVIVNDFGDVNVDASLVSGQIDEPASISGGCLCCLPDAGGLDEAMEKLSQPRLRLDAIVVEASGIAEPGALARVVRYSDVARIRFGGVLEVVDAAEYFGTVDQGGLPPARFSAASLVAINKGDRLPVSERSARLTAIEERIRGCNPDVHIVHTTRGRIDPALLYDTAATVAGADELPFAELADDADEHRHAASVSVAVPHLVEPTRVLAFLEDPPPSAYRIKGTLAVRSGDTLRSYTVNNVAGSVHIERKPGPGTGASELVVIGMDLDREATRTRLEAAMAEADGSDWAGLKRLQRYHRLSRN